MCLVYSDSKEYQFIVFISLLNNISDIRNSNMLSLGKGHYYKFHNIKNQKEHRKICKPSLHRKSLFSWSLLQHHYIENGFLVDHYIKNHCLFSLSLLRKSESRKECEKNIESLSFVWFSHFNYLWRKYLWHYWLFNKSLKTF